MSTTSDIKQLEADIEMAAARSIATSAQISEADALSIVREARRRFDLSAPSVAAVAALLAGGSR